MKLYDLVKSARSYRRFDNSKKIPRETLLSWIDCARLTMSSVNIQPIKYYISCSDETNAIIRPHTRWAGLLSDWSGPSENENPAAYIVVCVDGAVKNATPERFAKDVGIVSQTIILRAAEDGFGSCMIGSFDGVISEKLGFPVSCKPALVLAFGKSAETVVLDTLEPNGDSAYFRDENDTHHVPKRKLEDILL